MFAVKCNYCAKMGNCLKINSSDDISLLRGSESVHRQNSGPLPMFQVRLFFQNEQYQQIFFPSPSTSIGHAPIAGHSQLSEEDQVKIAKRIGLMQHLPIGTYDGSSKKSRECVICMAEFCVDEAVRYLPCMHIYHVKCIDDWLMRSLTCPSCLEPVDAALLTSYETT
ncbi:RING finger protein 11 isoform X3 [Drosophila pseudoobscura]|uniref:RING finger protein 11 isoform X3 n=1 Tax=Drosophila pseudoobscura pseudoobscura TaxID=46245 RepID=A0A6I8W1I3_DROPS|nr:RING finger protein 11 isoform X3 [Drosophila pseudoobscura]